jgi:TolB-like protein
MKRVITISIILGTLAALLIAQTQPSSSGQINTISIMPIEQNSIPEYTRIEQETVNTQLRQRLTRTPDFQLANFQKVREKIDNSVVDEAVFELLVTDNLDNTLSRLADMETPQGRTAEYIRAARALQIQYLLSVKIRTANQRLLVTCDFINTADSKIDFTRNFHFATNNPAGLANEIAKRSYFSLYQLNCQNNSKTCTKIYSPQR